MNKIEQTINSIFENLGYEIPKDTTTQLSDMELDSRDLSYAMTVCEKEFDILIEDKDLMNIKTYFQCIDLIKSIIEKIGHIKVKYRGLD